MFYILKSATVMYIEYFTNGFNIDLTVLLRYVTSEAWISSGYVVSQLFYLFTFTTFMHMTLFFAHLIFFTTQLSRRL